MTENLWHILSASIKSLNAAPSWLREFGNMTYEQVLHLPPLGDETKGSFAAPSVTEKPVASDFLDFLREQIRLNARGQEWTKVLKDRLEALLPFVGKNVITASLYQKPKSVTLYVNPDTGELFHFEFDE